MQIKMHIGTQKMFITRYR